MRYKWSEKTVSIMDDLSSYDDEGLFRIEIVDDEDDENDEVDEKVEDKQATQSSSMIVCVIATEKNTGFIVTCTSCNKEDAQKYARYYRGIGYNAKILTYDELDKYQTWETEQRKTGNNY